MASVAAMTIAEVVLLLAGGLVAGVINAVAGGGSMITVPLLVLAGVPGNSANGSNRIGILTSTAASMASFRRLGVDGLSHLVPILLPVVAGSLTGSLAISQLTDETFERAFGLLMIPLILLSIRKPKLKTEGVNTWSTVVTSVVFFAIGIYGGAVQAGVGLVLLAALTRAGFDLVTANSIKVVINFSVTAAALPIFLVQGNIVWLPAVILAIGLTIGGWIGPHVAVKGGETVIRVFMVVAAIALAARLLGLFG